MVGAHLHQNIALAANEACQFQYTLARNDDLLSPAATRRLGQFQFAKRQTVTVSGYRTHHLAVRLKQQAIEVITNVLVSHAETALFQQALQLRLSQFQRLRGIDFLNRRIFRGRQRGQREPTTAALHFHLVRFQFHGYRQTSRQRFHDVQELAPRNRDVALAVHLHAAPSHQLDLKVCGSDSEGAIANHHQHIGQDGHGLTSLHHAHDGLEGT